MSEDNLTVNEELKRLGGVFQSIFSQIMRLALKKTLHQPGRCDNNVDNYNYYLTNEAIGWRGQNITAVKVVSKSLRAKIPVNYMVRKSPKKHCRFPPNEKCPTNRLPGAPAVPPNISQPSIRLGKAAPTYFSPNSYYQQDCYAPQKYTGCYTGKPLTTTISNGDTCTNYVSLISYTDIWKQLESIGFDIIRETDPLLSEEQTSRLSTAMLRVYLFNLNFYLAALSPSIYDGVIDLIHLINSVDCHHIIDVISLIAVATERRWEELTPCVREKFIDKLGIEFITEFFANEVITILIQSNQGDVILELAYGYSVLKMLYIIFGYGMIRPILTGCNKSKCQVETERRLNNYRDKFRGGRQQQGDCGVERVEKCDRCDNCDGCKCDEQNSCSEEECTSEDPPCEETVVVTVKDPFATLSCEPVSPGIIYHIQIFIELYPNINQIMVNEIPRCYPYVDCAEIPATYKFVPSISGYLRRYFYFSYCFYRTLVDSLIQQNDTAKNVNTLISQLRRM